MKKIIILVALLILVAAGGYYTTRFEKGAPALPETQTYNDTVLGVSFEASPDYVVMEQDANASGPNLIKTIILMDRADYQSVINGEREGGEGPPAITLQAFRNPEKLSERSWVEKNPAFSNFPLLRGEMRPTTVAGIPGISYEADGLYASRNVVFASGGKIYLASGSYIDHDSEIYRDFDSFLESIKFH